MKMAAKEVWNQGAWGEEEPDKARNVGTQLVLGVTSGASTGRLALPEGRSSSSREAESERWPPS